MDTADSMMGAHCQKSIILLVLTLHHGDIMTVGEDSMVHIFCTHPCTYKLQNWINHMSYKFASSTGEYSETKFCVFFFYLSDFKCSLSYTVVESICSKDLPPPLPQSHWIKTTFIGKWFVKIRKMWDAYIPYAVTRGLSMHTTKQFPQHNSSSDLGQLKLCKNWD